MRLIAILLLGFSAFSQAEVLVEDPKIRLLPPGVPNTAAYLTLTNAGSETRILVGAHSDIAEKVELHNHVMQDGMMKMTRQDSVEIQPGQQVLFQPGGLHIMMFGLKTPLQEGQGRLIRLMFKNGEAIVVEAVVTEQTGKGSQPHHHE